MQSAVRECLLLFGADSFVFQFAVKNVKVKIQRTIVLPFVLYGCETCYPTVSEKHRLRVFGNRVLRKIFGPTWGEVMGEWGR